MTPQGPSVGSLTGKVAVVTGATSGIGRWIAIFLAHRGAATVIVGRSLERTEAVAKDIAGGTGNPEIYAAPVTDLALRSETARIATSLLDRFPQIHILVNNAGGYFHRREVTAEGLERTFALNVLSPFLLTRLLLPRLVSGAPSRVVMVASAAHRGNRVDLGDLQGERRYRGYRAYGRSKLELILLARELARRLRQQNVTVNAVHPGFVASGFGKNNHGAIGATIGFLSHAFGRSVRDAGNDVAYIASSPDFDSVSGVYFSRRTIRPGASASHDPETGGKLFEACERLTETYR